MATLFEPWRRFLQAPALPGLALPSLPDDPRVERDQVDLLVNGFRLAILATLSGPLLTAWLFQEFVSMAWAWGPAVAVYALHGERYFFLRRFAVARQSADYQPLPWARGVAWRLGAMGLLLAVWTTASTASGNPTAMFYALTLAAVMSAGALTQFCIFPPALWAFVTPFLLGITAQLLWIGSKSALVSSVFIAVLWGTLVAASRRFSTIMQRDLAQRYRTEALVAALSAQKDRAEEASMAKSRFLAAASHDLRQPVHAVALLAGALQDRQLAAADQALLQRLQGGVAHFADVVDEVLDVARLDAGAVQVKMQSVRLQDLLDRIDATYSELARAKGLALMIRPPNPPGACVLADAALLWRVLSNLVGNAVRYTVQGSVLVVVRRDSDAGLFAQNSQNPTAPTLPSAWRIEVRDSGPGIPMAQQNLIFEEFYQLHNPQRDSKQGLGLGLAVARRMAGLMGLRIGLQSRENYGATFSIAVKSIDSPANRLKSPVSLNPDSTHGSGNGNGNPSASAATPAAIPNAGPRSLHGLRVLVVDDDEFSRNAMAELLGAWGVQPQLAANATQAAALAQQHRPAVLITDHWLAAGEDAFGVAQAVQQALEQAAQPFAAAQPLHIAVFTGDISPATQQAVLQRGWHFAPKPVRALALRMWLESLPCP